MQTRSKNNIKIVDVSHHQGIIDWQKVKSSGVPGAYIKATEGVGYIDPCFRQNAGSAPAAGLKVGYYHYARPETGNSAAAEAESFLAAVKDTPSDLPHVLDLEGDASKLGASKLTAWALEWLDSVGQSDHRVMLYTGAAFARSYCGAALGKYPLWIAHYGVETPMGNSTWDKWSMFQYTSSAIVDGIAGKADMSEMDIDFWNDVTGQVAKITFPDVPADHWAAGAIERAAEAGILSGYPDGTYKPGQAVTRAELAAVVIKLLQK